MGKVGQPKITFYIRFIIAYKVIQYQKRWNLTPRAAWLKFSEHKAFKDLMRDHFKNKTYTEHWVNNNLDEYYSFNRKLKKFKFEYGKPDFINNNEYLCVVFKKEFQSLCDKKDFIKIPDEIELFKS